MDIKHIKNLADILKSSGLNVLEITEGENRIRLEKNSVCVQSGQKPVFIEKEEKAGSNNIEESVNGAKGVDFNNIKEVKSPIVGTFYSSPSPEARPFVKVGDKIRKGAVLCIVEAMKLMNEICSECDGEIIDICAQNDQVVEYGQTLFKIY